MSLFRDENPYLGLVTHDQISNPPVSQEGQFWNSATQKNLQFFLNGQLLGNHAAIAPNVTPVTGTNKTSAFALQTVALPAGFLNAVGKGLYVYAAGTYNLGAASTQTYTIALGSNTLASFSVGNNANTGVALPWNMDLYCITQTAGSSGAVEAHGIMNIGIGATAAAAITSYNDANTATISLDVTAAYTLQVTALLGTGNASSSQTSRILLAEVFN